MSDVYAEYLARKAARDRECPAGGVPLTLGAREQHIVFVSAEHYPWLSQWRWSFLISRSGAIYGRRKTSIGGVVKTIMLHNTILIHCLGKPRPSPKHTGDHIDHNTINNCGWNLQWLTPREQVMRQPYQTIGRAAADIPF